MSKSKEKMKYRERAAKQGPAVAAPMGGLHAMREMLESIVIAFVLAFLFRTFEAEAFVIPTGSMSPSLQGQHKDVDCSECGYRFRTTASSEGDERDKLKSNREDPTLADIVAGTCPMCRQTMAFRRDLPLRVPPHIDQDDISVATTYPGDRILVNKYTYAYQDPQRWDVVVFKFPGNGQMNYIKRLVGLPNETLRIYQGDLFTRPTGGGAEYRIERKPIDKVPVMLQPVHDTQHECSRMYRAGWPLRWEPDASQQWRVEAEAGAQNVRQQYFVNSLDGQNDSGIAWLRYRHRVPTENDWFIAREFSKTGAYPVGTTKEQWLSEARPTLIRDFNSYNARYQRIEIVRRDNRGRTGWSMRPYRYGRNWVSDLAVDCRIQVERAAGEVLLDLVEGGKHFTCRIDLQTGQANISAGGAEEVASLEPTSVSAPGQYQLRFSNVDDQLLLWVDDELVSFGEQVPGVQYDAEEIFGDRSLVLPATSSADLGDLAPVGVGARGATFSVDRLQVLRDIYYVAVRAGQMIPQYQDYPEESLDNADGPLGHHLLFAEPASWNRFKLRKKYEFSIDANQFFVMGDNSPESADCRLWNMLRDGGKPGGAYLDRRMLIGKAVCVFWPHSWGSIPGLNQLPGFPNFGDMRIVR
ncbi:MAG: signal peptidase I [Pirellulales bacterium]|nr:signal peptidase I [Pirellulales bacterium]